MECKMITILLVMYLLINPHNIPTEPMIWAFFTCLILEIVETFCGFWASIKQFPIKEEK